jgi:uncharacterized YigZ family protein
MQPFYYQTLSQKGTAEYSDRGSRFIAYAFPVTNADAFKAGLQELKKAHPKASHLCFAYRIGADGQQFRVSDAGEPSGSAGRPILGQIDSRELTNTAVVVVRYFGGTLLGVPGLIQAYKTAASLALQITPAVRKPVLITHELQFNYTCLNDVMMVVRRHHCVIENQEQQLFCLFRVGIPLEHLETCLSQLGHIRGVEIRLVKRE